MKYILLLAILFLFSSCDALFSSSKQIKEDNAPQAQERGEDSHKTPDDALNHNISSHEKIFETRIEWPE